VRSEVRSAGFVLMHSNACDTSVLKHIRPSGTWLPFQPATLEAEEPNKDGAIRQSPGLLYTCLALT